MKKKQENLDEPITKSFFIEYMDNFAISIARGFEGERNYMDKRFEQVDKQLKQVGTDINDLKESDYSIRVEMRRGFERVNEKIEKLDEKMEFQNKQRVMDTDMVIDEHIKLEKRVRKLETQKSF